MVWLLAAASSVLAQQPGQQVPELRALLDQFLAATDDPAMHQRFWDDALIYTSSSGARYGKAAILEGMQGGSPSETPEVRYRAEDTQVMHLGDVAVVAFRLVAETAGTKDAPAEVSEYFNTGTFRLADGEWRAVAWQATRIPAEP
jgi:ketosteroid isomerase-like protein